MKYLDIVRKSFLALAVAGAWMLSGCGSETADQPMAEGPIDAEGPGEMQFCDWEKGPENAPVTVVAFYPGRHEDTLAAVKGLLDKYPEKVRVEVVDWRHKEGRETRDKAGLTCAGITINGQNAFDLTIDGKREKVMFVRGINGDWTEAQLIAAVEQELGDGGATAEVDTVE